MSLLFDGIKIGLILCFLLGPIFFTLIQTGVEEGVRAGIMVGLGIWISDLLFIVGTFWGLSYLNKIVHWNGFELYLGIAGSIILALFGILTFFSKPPAMYQPAAKRFTSWFSLWVKGFLINTVNPFTVFFWIGLMSPILLKDKMGSAEAFLFFGGILTTIVITDFLKVLMAKKIRRWLRPLHLLWIRKISGLALLVFGAVLILRVLF